MALTTLVCCLVREADARTGAAQPGALEDIARACSPRVDPYAEDAVVFDASGLSRVLGPPATIAQEVATLAADRGLMIRIAIAATTTPAWIAAHARIGSTIITPGNEARALAELPVSWLLVVPEKAQGERLKAQGAGLGNRGEGLKAPNEAPSLINPGFTGAEGRRPTRAPSGRRIFPQMPAVPPSSANAEPRAPSPKPQAPSPARLAMLSTLERWGIRTCGDFARLPRAEVHARFGDDGVRLHEAACGRDVMRLEPAREAREFVERIDLEHPIEGLEPLAFVLARLCDALSLALERADRGAVDVTTRARLVSRRTHERTLHLPAPMRDARVLRTLIVLDLETHPPDAAIDGVEISLAVTPGRIVQGALLAHTLPSPEDVATLTARLAALMGESRVGAPVLVDTHDERKFTMKMFRASAEARASEKKSARGERGLPSADAISLRRLRMPIAARVIADRGTPVRVEPAVRSVAGGRVVACAGPWRSSGQWWSLDRAQWDRDVWDVELADGGVYLLARDRTTKQWLLEGTFD